MNRPHQVLARTCRPQRFRDVVGQEAIVTTLRNALKNKKVGQAYLFCGSHGTGKTTLARLLSKSLNCSHPTVDFEPCNECPSCLDIMRGQSLDCLEIDGASHRGVEDVRQMNEAIHFLPSRGNWKIYLIDEVHMLTKEAWNALLKTLEEPPSHVKFFFCTTEPYRLPPTILSRCQRFTLRRLTEKEILENLKLIMKNQGYSIPSSDAGLQRMARAAEGSLREAQSLCEQLLSFAEGDFSDATVRELLGVPPETLFSRLDQAKGQPTLAFDIVSELYTAGKPFAPFLQELAIHFRSHLLNPPTHPVYRKEQLLDILEIVQNSWLELKHAPSERAHVEMTLVQIIRSHERLNPKELLAELHRLEKIHCDENQTLRSITNHDPRSIEEAPSMIQPKIEEAPPMIQPKIEEAPSMIQPKIEEAPSMIQPKIEEVAIPTNPEITSTAASIDGDTFMRFAAKELHGVLQILTLPKKS